MIAPEIVNLNHQLGSIDIYLLDQILKTRFNKTDKILDAGCGEGRNLIFFIRNNYHVYGIDKNPDSIQMLKHLSKSINKEFPIDRFVSGDISSLPYKNEFFDAIISSAVLHFAENKNHFLELFEEHIRILKKGGILFMRMTTDFGLDGIEPLSDGKNQLPDGSVRFLLTESLLKIVIERWELEFVEPLKSVLVLDQRSMGTVILKKK